MSNELLIFIPTYNERENVESIIMDIMGLSLSADILFIDDSSPDGTGDLLEEFACKYENVIVQHRAGKLGVGSAHKQGIKWAYDNGYKLLITMDCDFTHSPKKIIDFLKKSDDADVVVGSRYMDTNSLVGWNLFRKLLTNLGHSLTKFFLKMPYDATGGFRLYRLDSISSVFLNSIYSSSYSFFFESLYVLHLNNFRIVEISTVLPARVYGHSKMRIIDAWYSLMHLVDIYFTTLLNRERFEFVEPFNSTTKNLKEDKDWNNYWSGKDKPTHLVYDLIAAFYRRFIIRPSLNHFIRKYFDRDSQVMHAGCGSGQVDIGIADYIKISAIDISVQALSIYKKTNKHHQELIHGSIFSIPVENDFYDGIYNLGVMEHFPEDEIVKILSEFHRVLKPDGKCVLFWPPEFGLSVIFLKFVHFILNRVLKKDILLHPAEITRVTSKAQVADFLSKTGFSLVEYSFGIRDFFTYVVVIGQKTTQRT